jgi:hypothetical protein
MQMVEQLVTRQREMQLRHAAASSFRQTTMTQEFGKPCEPEHHLPPGWIQLPDNSLEGGRPYFFNTLDHDIQVDIAKVYERVAMTAAANAAAANENLCTRTHKFAYPDGVVSSSNNTISPSPPGGRHSGRKKLPPGYVAPSTFGGWVEIPTSEDDSATELTSTGTQLRESSRKQEEGQGITTCCHHS